MQPCNRIALERSMEDLFFTLKHRKLEGAITSLLDYHQAVMYHRVKSDLYCAVWEVKKEDVKLMNTLVADKRIMRLDDGAANMSKLEVNGWTFMYDPSEIVMDLNMQQYLSEFRTDDGETVFVLAMHDNRLVIY